MKFCRNCGAQLPPPSAAGPLGAAAPGGTPTPAPIGGPYPAMAGSIGGFPAPPPAVGAGGAPGMAAALQPTMLPTHQAAVVGAAPAPVRAAQGSTIACPRCGTPTPLGFAFCQQCGLHLQGSTASDPGAAPRAVVPVVAQPASLPGAAGLAAGRRDAPIDPHAGTIAQDNLPAAQAAAPAPVRAVPHPQAGPGWGTAVLVNRDGTDGERFPLTGEYVVIGRAGADIPFPDDRFLAREHARLAHGADGAVTVHPLDTLNGVFRKADAPVELTDGTTILVGREVLRYERVEPEESKLHPLVRHGVALFGSPPREPWGRFVQLVPSGGHRDVRHLIGAEMVLGREDGDIVFRDDAFMSRRHAAVTWDGQRAQITDLGSSNGTFVRLTGPTALRHGDHVRLGDQLLRLELGRT